MLVVSVVVAVGGLLCRQERFLAAVEVVLVALPDGSLGREHGLGATAETPIVVGVRKVAWLYPCRRCRMLRR